MLAFTQSNFPIQLFRDVLQGNTTIFVLRIYAHLTAAKLTNGGYVVKIFYRIERGKIKNLRLIWSNRMETEHVLFSSTT